MSFPDISSHLQPTSNCSIAERMNGGRHLARVLLAIYEQIPVNYADIRLKYVECLGHWLDNSVVYIAPELFPCKAWVECDMLLQNFFSSYFDTEWVNNCQKIYCGQNVCA